MITIAIGDRFTVDREPVATVFAGYDWIQHYEYLDVSYATTVALGYSNGCYYGFSWVIIDEEW